jgi:melibiose permease/lactose/raffinose/galactose permease
VLVLIGYGIFFFAEVSIVLIALGAVLVFVGQAFIQTLMLMFLADTVEYGEWKLGKRNEAASFAVQPFINQFGGAASKGIVSFTLIISGINMIANAAGANPEKAEEIIAATPDSAIWIMKISMMILPLICILIGFVLYIRKFKIDEKMYEQIVSDLKSRDEKAEVEDEVQA